ncbi:recombinase family protein [Mucilaginibacter sp. OK098]|uniref:recombinase family protein n=1 Tax=Mucilaginibacter sp. OK098 TaxID=1855297 RepID=UPI00091364D0|nr:recombinase family protein [Mucilaginibacter sp. OK098]SHN26102.1 Site-specific DNA recombinase [Mucilaginibacter sp. OK098]
MNKEKIIYFQYARKSSEGEDRQALSIPAQLRDNAQVINRNNLTIVDTLTDEASASIPFNRAGYTDMIRRIKKGEASGIVVWHVNRLIRNPMEEGEFKWLLQTGVIKSIWTPNREYRSEDNALLFSIEASMATQYTRDLSVNVKRGMRQQYERGEPAGIAPLGYLNTKFPISGTNYTKENPVVLHILRKGFDLMLTGAYTVKEVGTILYQEYGLRSKDGRQISKNALYKLFINPFYYGYFTRNGIMYKGNYKPIITVQEYDQIQHILGKKGKPRYKRLSFPFTGFITCGSCSCAVTATEKLKMTKAGELKSYVFYYCTKRRKGSEHCPEKQYTTKAEMEALIINELSKYEIVPAFKEWATEYYKTYYQAEIDKRNSLAQAELMHEQKLTQELDTLLDLRITNSISEEKFEEKKFEKEQLLIRVTAKRNKYENVHNDWLSIIEDNIEFAIGAVEAFKNGDEKAKKKICNQFGWNWTLKGKKLFIDKQEWLRPIKNMIEIYNYYLRRLEPEKTLIKSDFDPLTEYLSFSMSALCSYVRNHKPNYTQDSG